MGLHVHVDTCSAHSLDAESFLCAFSRFTARRGYPKDMYSDNGTNFVGAPGIFKDEFKKIQSDKEQSRIHNQLRKEYHGTSIRRWQAILGEYGRELSVPSGRF